MVLSDTIPGWKAMYPFAIGGTAACMATTCIQPIDMVKVRIQLQEGGAAANPIKMASTIIKEEGFLTMYRGLSAGILRQLTYGMSRLGIFQTLEAKFKDEKGVLPFEKRVGASLCAGGIGALFGTPADAALVRMQADTVLPEAQRRGYKNGLDAMFRMAKEEGVKGFFSGAAPTVYRGLVMNLGMLVSKGWYEEKIKPYTGDGTQVTRFVSGGLSGMTAATMSLPFDFIKTRLQKQTAGPNGEMQYKGFIDCVRKVVAAEGPLALYQGYTTYLVRITPHIMLTWVFMDNLKDIAFLK